MIHSVALVFSIVASRIWVPVGLAVYAPGVLTGGPIDEVVLAQVAGVGSWLSWVVNLLVAEWWLIRTRSRRAVESAHEGRAAVHLGRRGA